MDGPKPRFLRVHEIVIGCVIGLKRSPPAQMEDVSFLGLEDSQISRHFDFWMPRISQLSHFRFLSTTCRARHAVDVHLGTLDDSAGLFRCRCGEGSVPSAIIVPCEVESSVPCGW